jgi:hypothetical protein
MLRESMGFVNGKSAGTVITLETASNFINTVAVGFPAGKAAHPQPSFQNYLLAVIWRGP